MSPARVFFRSSGDHVSARLPTTHLLVRRVCGDRPDRAGPGWTGARGPAHRRLTGRRRPLSRGVQAVPMPLPGTRTRYAEEPRLHEGDGCSRAYGLRARYGSGGLRPRRDGGRPQDGPHRGVRAGAGDATSAPTMPGTIAVIRVTSCSVSSPASGANIPPSVVSYPGAGRGGTAPSRRPVRTATAAGGRRPHATAGPATTAAGRSPPVGDHDFVRAGGARRPYGRALSRHRDLGLIRERAERPVTAALW